MWFDRGGVLSFVIPADDEGPSEYAQLARELSTSHHKQIFCDKISKYDDSGAKCTALN